MSVCPVGDKQTKAIVENSPATPTPGKKQVLPPPVGPGQLRDESCNITNSITNSTGGTAIPNGSTTTVESQTVQTCEPLQGWGFEWKSVWAAGEVYVAQSNEHPLASVVHYNGSAFVCKQDHISDMSNSPVLPNSAMNNMGDWAAGQVYTTYSDTHQASVVTYEGASWYCIQDHISELANSPVDGGSFWARLDTENGSDGSGAQYWDLHVLAGSNGTGGSGLPTVEKSYLDQLMDFKDNVFDWIENASLEDWLKAGAIAAGVIWAGNEIIDAIYGDGEGDGNASSSYNGSAGYSGAYTAPSLPDVVSSLCEFAGVAYDVSALPEEPVSFVVGQTTSVRTILSQLSVMFQFDMVDSGGILKFVPRSAASIKTITMEDMGFDDSDMPPTAYTAKRYQGVDLPKQVSLTYYSENLDYSKYTQTYSLHTFEEGQNVDIQIPVTISDARARQVAELALINSHLERMNYRFNTTYKFVDVEPGDILNSPMGLIRILKVQEKKEGVLEFEACDAGAEVALQASNMGIQAPTEISYPVNTSAPLGYSSAFFIDPTNLNDQDTGVRIYAAVHGYGRAGWPGAVIYMSEDNGLNFYELASTTSESTIGLVETAVAPHSYHTWDEDTEIVVKLNSGSLLSMSDLAVLNGQNWAQIGQELIGFKNAELIAEKTYKLTGLLRGRQGTEQYIGTHQANELFCLIDDLVKLEFPDSDRGSVKQFKVVTIGSSIDKAEAKTVQIISNNARMWTVYKPVVALQGNDWIISWNERVRFDNQIKDFATTNHDPDWAGFGIAILADDGVTVKSTHIVQGSSFTYTAAQQTLDFGTIQPGIKVSIVQMSQKWGGGYPVVINS